jgi:hypothetical protein
LPAGAAAISIGAVVAPATWVGAMLDGVGPFWGGTPWLHRACPTCLVPLPCS